MAGAKGNGSVNTDYESVVIRRVPMMFRLKAQEGLFPALSIEALRALQGRQPTDQVVRRELVSCPLARVRRCGLPVKTGDVRYRRTARGG